MSPPFMLSVLMLSLSIAFSLNATAQCDTNQTFNYTIGPSTGNPADTIPRSKVSAGYLFEMRYDSSRTIYQIAEVRYQGAPVWWHTWCRGDAIRNADAGQLSDSTRTKAFMVSTGDTISFFRSLEWFNQYTQESKPDNYYATDSLDYAVELIRSSDGMRLALLDSIGVLDKVPSGSPVLHGTRPILASVKYVVPSAIDGNTVRVRVRVYSRGGGSYYFIRRSGFGIALSDRLSDSLWQEYIDAASGGLAKRVHRMDVFAPEDAESTLTVIPNPTPGEVTIHFNVPADNGSAAVAIYDVNGRYLFTPAFSPRLNGGASARFHFPTPGVYIVALFHRDQLVGTQKVTVNR